MTVKLVVHNARQAKTLLIAIVKLLQLLSAASTTYQLMQEVSCMQYSDICENVFTDDECLYHIPLTLELVA